jgi:hypothetical protein
MADAHIIWLHIAWAIAYGKNNRAAEIPEDARKELDEGLCRVVDFHERLMSLAVAARERLACPSCRPENSGPEAHNRPARNGAEQAESRN